MVLFAAPRLRIVCPGGYRPQATQPSSEWRAAKTWAADYRPIRSAQPSGQAPTKPDAFDGEHAETEAPSQTRVPPCFLASANVYHVGSGWCLCPCAGLSRWLRSTSKPRHLIPLPRHSWHRCQTLRTAVFRRFGSAPTTSSHSSEDGVMWRRTAGQRKSRQHDDGNRHFRVHGRSSESHCYRMSPNRQLLKQHGARAQIDTPAHVFVGPLSPLPNTLWFPLFAKPPSGYASIGIEPTSQDHRRQPRRTSDFSSSCDCCGTASRPIEVIRTARCASRSGFLPQWTTGQRWLRSHSRASASVAHCRNGCLRLLSRFSAPNSSAFTPWIMRLT